MAERRMMAKSIIKSDQFLDMPATTQNLYFHMLLDADDDGFVNAPKSIMRIVGAKDDDMKLLVAKQFVIGFGSGVIVIKHWKIHNYIQSDRYKPSLQPERALLDITTNKEYTLNTSDVSSMDTECIQSVSVGKVSIGKASIGKDSIGKDSVYSGCDKSQPTRTHFTPPTLEEVKAYCIERNNNIDAEYFIDFQEARGWVLSNGKKMKDWKATIRTWERNNYNRKPVNKNSKEDAINVVNNLMSKLGGDGNEQSATDTESTIDVTASVHY